MRVREEVSHSDGHHLSVLDGHLGDLRNDDTLKDASKDAEQVDTVAHTYNSQNDRSGTAILLPRLSSSNRIVLLTPPGRSRTAKR